MRSYFSLSTLILAGLSFACRPATDTRAAVDALLARDKAWSAASGGGASADSIATFWSVDARVVLPGAPVMVGREAARQMVMGSLATPGFHISWVPDSAVVASSGDLGYTYGTTTVSMADSAGHVSTEVGRYITVWVKGSDGQWRCVYDSYNVGPTAAAKST